MASSTTLQLGKSSWPSQILLVCRLGKRWTTQETQTLPAPNHTLSGTRYMPTLLLHCTIASSSRALADILEYSLGRCDVDPHGALLFHYIRHSTIDLSLLHLKTASETQNHLTFSYWVPEHQGTGGLSVSNLCLCHSHLSTHIVSCMCISIVILH